MDFALRWGKNEDLPLCFSSPELQRPAKTYRRHGTLSNSPQDAVVNKNKLEEDASDIITKHMCLGGILGQQKDLGGSESSAAVVCLPSMYRHGG